MTTAYEGTLDGIAYIYDREARTFVTAALRHAGVSTASGADGSWYKYFRAGADGFDLPAYIRCQLTVKQVSRFIDFVECASPEDRCGFELYGECFERGAA